VPATRCSGGDRRAGRGGSLGRHAGLLSRAQAPLFHRRHGHAASLLSGHATSPAALGRAVRCDRGLDAEQLREPCDAAAAHSPSGECRGCRALDAGRTSSFDCVGAPHRSRPRSNGAPAGRVVWWHAGRCTRLAALWHARSPGRRLCLRDREGPRRSTATSVRTFDLAFEAAAALGPGPRLCHLPDRAFRGGPRHAGAAGAGRRQDRLRPASARRAHERTDNMSAGRIRPRG